MRCTYLLLLGVVSIGASLARDPLPSWNKTTAKQRILTYVRDASRLPAEQRVAVFDNDGTLWSEQPMYFQLLFALDQVKTLAPKHPEWQTREPFASVLKGDVQAALAGGLPAALQIMAAPHDGVTTEEFAAAADAWLKTARHPTTKRLYTEMVFQPMVELLRYLRKKGFRTFIVSGGGIEFMRVFSEQVYGVPPEQVVGTTVKTSFSLEGGQPVLRMSPSFDFVDDGSGKPVGIHKNIGRKPVFVAGNSDGDLQMLQYGTIGGSTAFGLIVHHTDAAREFAYDRASSIGHLDKALDEAAQRNWLVVDMKNDWKTIFAWEGRNK